MNLKKYFGTINYLNKVFYTSGVLPSQSPSYQLQMHNDKANKKVCHLLILLKII